MASTGLVVVCHAWAPKQKNRQHSVSRTMCLANGHEYCPQCENYNFVLHIPFKIGDQVVACPRWNNGQRIQGNPPSGYQTIRRETCLRTAPFEYCGSCLNSHSEEPPMSDPGWYERVYRK